MINSEIQKLLGNLPAMLAHAGGDDVLLGALGSFELNLQGSPFPGWSTSESRKYVADILLNTLRNHPSYKWAYSAEMTEISHDERLVLLERNQITATMSARQDGVHVLINDKQDTVCYINDEEHLLLQVFFPGTDVLASTYEAMKQRMEELCKDLPVAKDPILGYVSCDPTKAGESIYISIILHLPGLRMGKHMLQVQRAMDDMSLFFSPMFSHYQPRDDGDMYLLHTPIIAKGKKAEAMHIVSNALIALYRHELLARGKLVDTEKSTQRIYTSIYRAYKRLTESKTLKYMDMLSDLSLIRLGLFYGMIKVKHSAAKAGRIISRMFCEAAPAYMRYVLGHEKLRQRRQARAAYAREMMLKTLHASILEKQK